MKWNMYLSVKYWHCDVCAKFNCNFIIKCKHKINKWQEKCFSVYTVYIACCCRTSDGDNTVDKPNSEKVSSMYSYV